MFTTLYGKLLIGCLAVLTVISFVAALSNRRTTDSYTSVIMTALAYGLVEIIWHSCSTDLVTFTDNVVKLVGSVRILFIVLLGYMLANYFMTRNGRKLDVKMLIFTLIQIVIVLDVNIFYALLFSYTAETGLVKGFLYPVPYAFYALYGLLLFILLLTGEKKDVLGLVCAVLIIICGVGQMFTDEFPLIYLGAVIIMFAVTISLPSRKKKSEAVAEEQPETAEQPVSEFYPMPQGEEIIQPQPEIIVEPEEIIEEPAEAADVHSVEQLPEYKFDFIDEALEDETPVQPEVSQPVVEDVITEENILEDIPELRDIEQLIESETATDLPVIDESQPAVPQPVDEDNEIQSILDQISGTIVSDSYDSQPLPAEPEPVQPQYVEPQPVEPQPVTEDTLTSLSAIQQAYDTEIQNNLEEERRKRERQQLHNQKIISKPVISPLGPMPRPGNAALTAGVATAGALAAGQLFDSEPQQPAVTPEPEQTLPAEYQIPAAEPIVEPVVEPAVEPAEEPVIEPAVEPLPVIKTGEVKEVGSRKSAVPEPFIYEKPRTVTRPPLEQPAMNPVVQPVTEEVQSPRQDRTPVTLPNIAEIITASQIAHGEPAEKTPEEAGAPEPVEENKPAYRPRFRKSSRVMIIGSSSSEVRLISETLKKEKGYRVDVIDDGYLAMELLAGPFAKVFDGIIAVDQPSYSDIYSTIRMIRECEFREIATLPIICLVNDDPRRNQMIQNSGISAFVYRPLDIDALCAVLREQLEKHGW